MKRILLVLALLFTIVSSYAQVENAFRGSLNIFASAGTDPTFTFTGFFNDQLGKYASSDVQTGDAIYILYEDRCVRLVVTNISSSVGGIISGTMTNQDNGETVSAPPNGVGLIMRETPNHTFPTTLSGVSEDLLSCIRTKFTLMVDLAIDTAQLDGNGIISALPLGDVLIFADGNSLELDSADVRFRGPNGNTGFFWDAVESNLGINTSPTFELDVLGTGRFVYNAQLDGYVQITPNSGSIAMKGTTGTHAAYIGISAEEWSLNYNANAMIIADTSGRLKLKANSGTISRLYGEDSNGRLVYTTSFDLTGGGVTIYEYTRDSVTIRATDTTVTVVTADGSATINVPTGVHLLSASIHGDGSYLDGSNNFTVTINTASTQINTSRLNMVAPDVQIINAAGALAGGPSGAAPFVYDEGSSPQRQITAIGNGDITIKIIALNAFDPWAIKLNF